MPTPLSPADVAAQLGDLLEAYDANDDKAAFVAGYTALWQDATVGGTDIPLIGAQLSSWVGLWKHNQDQFSDWMAGTEDFDSDDPAQPQLGWYPLTNHLGIERWFPSPNRMLADFAGIQVKGTLANTALLPPGDPNGSIYIVNGHMWVKNPTQWVDAGPFVGPQGDKGTTGDKGWSAILALVADGARFVLQVIDWTGGQGAKPATGTYIGAAGLVATAAQAINVRGPQGDQGPQGVQGPKGDHGNSYDPDAMGLFSTRATYNAQPEGFGFLATDTGTLYFRTGASGTWTAGVPFGKGDKGDKGDTGDKGWAPLVAAVPDGARRVWQVVDWVGGTGVKPASVGYVGATGIVGSIVDAIDVRGPTGATGPQGDKGTKGDTGSQGAPFTINAVDIFNNRSVYNSQPAGFVFLAQDQAKLYVRVGSAGNWSAGTPLVSGDYMRFYLTGALTPGVEQTVNTPVAVNSITELFVTFNGLKVRAPDYGLSLVNAGTAVRFTAPSGANDVTGYYEIMLPGGVKGDTGANNATAITYDNTNSLLAATDVQAAIDEIKQLLAAGTTVPYGFGLAFSDYFSVEAGFTNFFRTDGPTDAGLDGGQGKYAARLWTAEFIPAGTRGNDAEFWPDPTFPDYPEDYRTIQPSVEPDGVRIGQFVISEDEGLSIILEKTPDWMVPLIPHDYNDVPYALIGGIVTTRPSFYWKGDHGYRVIYKGPINVGSWGAAWTWSRWPNIYHAERKKIEHDWPETIPASRDFSYAGLVGNKVEGSIGPDGVGVDDAPYIVIQNDLYPLGFDPTADFHEYIFIRRGRTCFYIADGRLIATKVYDPDFDIDQWLNLQLDVSAGGVRFGEFFGVFPTDGSKTDRVSIKSWEVFLPEVSPRVDNIRGRKNLGKSLVYDPPNREGYGPWFWYVNGINAADWVIGPLADKDLERPAVIHGQGQTWQGLEGYRAGALTAGTRYLVEFDFNYGTSEKLFLMLRAGDQQANETDINVENDVVTVTAGAAKYARILRLETVDGTPYRRLQFEWVAPVAGDVYVRFGPNSLVVGETVSGEKLRIYPML